MAGKNIRNIVIDDSIIMYFDAANARSATSSIFYDLSKNCGSSRTFTNNPVYSTLGGGSYTFNGTNQYMETTYSQLNVPYTGKTIIACGYLSTNFDLNIQGIPNYGFRAFFAKPNSTGTPVGQNIGRNWNFYIYNDNTGNGYQYHWSCYLSAGLSTYLPKTGPNAVVPGSWVVGAFTQDATGLCTFYHNGVVAGTYSATFQQYYNHPTDGERIGASATGVSNYNGGAFWNGNIATVLIYKRGLTEAEIRKNYNVYSYRYGLPQLPEL